MSAYLGYIPRIIENPKTPAEERENISGKFSQAVKRGIHLTDSLMARVNKVWAGRVIWVEYCKEKKIHNTEILAAKLGYIPRVVANPKNQAEEWESIIGSFISEVIAGKIHLSASQRARIDKVTASYPQYREYVNENKLCALESLALELGYIPRIIENPKTPAEERENIGGRLARDVNLGGVHLTVNQKQRFDKVISSYPEFRVWWVDRHIDILRAYKEAGYTHKPNGSADEKQEFLYVDKQKNEEKIKIRNLANWCHKFLLGRRDSNSKKVNFVASAGQEESFFELWDNLLNNPYDFSKSNRSRHLDTRSATMEQITPLAQEPHEIIYYKDFLKQGTVILEGYFHTDKTNEFNPKGFNAPDNLPKNPKTYFDQSFTPEENQQAVEYALYKDIQDLLRSMRSKTNFALPKPNRRGTPRTREIHNENTALRSIADALDIVQDYAGRISDADYKLLQNVYLEAAAEPANIEKCRELVNVLKELQAQYLADKFAAFCLVLENNYKAIEEIFGEMIKNTQTTFEQYNTISGVLSLLVLFLDNPSPEGIRALSRDFNNHSAQIKKYWRKIMEQVELLVHN
ncbi:MAG: hypothetical protein LBD99_03010 [Candidatus Margulisbacteria bacterium]|nr:hypothetical protein [Candidatus Margulisiibacteriota bacterium]